MRALTPSLFACSLLAGIATLAVTADARSAMHPAGVHASGNPTDVSTAKRKHRTHHRAYMAPVYGPPVYSQWGSADPSYGPGTPQLRAYQRMGRCVIDEGYGRYTPCGNW